MEAVDVQLARCWLRDWEFLYGKEIIQMASDESGIDVKLFGQVEEGTKVKASLFNKTGLYKGALIAPDQKDLFLMRIFLIIRQRLRMIWLRRSHA